MIASSGNTSPVAVWRIPIANPERMERLSPIGDEWRQPAVAPQHRRMAFTRAGWDENPWRDTLGAPGVPAGAPVPLVGSTVRR